MDDGTEPHGNHDVTAVSRQRAENNHGEGRRSHKRSKSGGILGGLAFLKHSKTATAKPPKQEDDRQVEDVEGTKGGSSLATALHQSQGRKRKGSLRKAAMAKMREHITVKPPTVITTMSTTSRDEDAPLRRLAHETPPHDSLSTFAVNNNSLDDPQRPTPQLLTSPTNSLVRTYASTTDEDEVMSFHPPSASSSNSSFNLPDQDPAMLLSRRRSNRSERRSSLTVVHTPSDTDLDEEWDYSETEWWGWVVLIVTWIVFVVGMGSCLGVWSWAWDVGETPYAPPDLEDDDTLPITGYYPALMVCTAVISWVWVVVAWVGMKYFRHAKVMGDDG